MYIADEAGHKFFSIPASILAKVSSGNQNSYADLCEFEKYGPDTSVTDSQTNHGQTDGQAGANTMTPIPLPGGS